MNSVMDERSLTASIPPKIASADRPSVASTSPGALAQARAQHRMGEVGARLLERGDRVEARHLALPEPGDLGKMNHIQWPVLRPARSSATTPA